MSEFDKKDLQRRMEGALENMKKDYSGLRTGRASVNLLDAITVDVYGAQMPISQVASLSAPEPRLLTVQVWDAGNTKAVEKAIMNSGLGLNPQGEGTLIRVPLPVLNAERRQDLVKVAGKYAESTRIAVRNIRRDAMDALKKMEKDSEISEDEHRRLSDEVQKMTDDFVHKIDALLHDKEKDIMTV